MSALLLSRLLPSHSSPSLKRTRELSPNLPSSPFSLFSFSQTHQRALVSFSQTPLPESTREHARRWDSASPASPLSFSTPHPAGTPPLPSRCSPSRTGLKCAAHPAVFHPHSLNLSAPFVELLSPNQIQLVVCSWPVSF